MIIGLEGVSCVGKTSLAARLAVEWGAVLVPCFYRAAADPALLPSIDPATAADQLKALEVLLEVEERRRAVVAQAVQDGKPVVLDRTVDTLLAHAHAIGRLRGFDCDAEARTAVLATSPVEPDVTLLLTVDFAERARRAKHRPGMPQLLYEETFTGLFHEYFREPLVQCCITVDASDPQRLMDAARHWIRSVASTANPEATRLRSAPC